MLPKKYRLEPKNLQKIYKEGKKFRGEYGMLVVKELNINNPQFAFVVSKKIGNAVQRHKMTRLLRQITTEFLTKVEDSKLASQYIAFKYSDNYEELKKEYLKQLKDAFRIA
ncbi:ribonuclease P protein component [Candidatus Dojkabacteria bacterium HGW-Dojkabacteria-1]|uniref:Ribonuclease P protein component n=1 Tax=Candidatus Dojkabacteria bacterium HGW-Dojkabacteria-1 TaxID=2013761 RepID=A0A2N2F2S3_9BACT|nr:MAG: ribonuclease P protein component [Candidatus Dojkabacteria bacterium HGW-Dojkabacteria-1]